MAETKICSMYSYKGGTGRTVATANIACILAKRGKKVVCIDMDLDGGGLSVVFGPAVHSKVSNNNLRVEDKLRCIQDVFHKEVTFMKNKNEETTRFYTEISSDEDFMENWWGKMNFDIGEVLDKDEIKGKLFFIPARFGTDSVDSAAEDFAMSFPKFLNPLIDKISPDLILLDSSSGFQDYTLMLLERSNLFVVFFRWNSQAIEGTIEATKFLSDYSPSMKLLLVPSAVPKASLANYKNIHEASNNRIKNEIVYELEKKGVNINFFERGIGESALLKWKEEILVFSKNKLTEDENEILKDYENVADNIIKLLDKD